MKLREKNLEYKYLLFFIICFLSGLVTLNKKEDKNFLGWFILAISFLFLSTFFEQNILSEKKRKGLKILNYIIAAGLVLIGLLQAI